MKNIFYSILKAEGEERQKKEKILPTTPRKVIHNCSLDMTYRVCSCLPSSRPRRRKEKVTPEEDEANEVKPSRDVCVLKNKQRQETPWAWLMMLRRWASIVNLSSTLDTCLIGTLLENDSPGTKVNSKNSWHLWCASGNKLLTKFVDQK